MRLLVNSVVANCFVVAMASLNAGEGDPAQRELPEALIDGIISIVLGGVLSPATSA